MIEGGRPRGGRRPRETREVCELQQVLPRRALLSARDGERVRPALSRCGPVSFGAGQRPRRRATSRGLRLSDRPDSSEVGRRAARGDARPDAAAVAALPEARATDFHGGVLTIGRKAHRSQNRAQRHRAGLGTGRGDSVQVSDLLRRRSATDSHRVGAAATGRRRPPGTRGAGRPGGRRLQRRAPAEPAARPPLGRVRPGSLPVAVPPRRTNRGPPTRRRTAGRLAVPGRRGRASGGIRARRSAHSLPSQRL